MELKIEGISLKDIAKEYKTPVFVYDYEMIKKNVMEYKDALSDVKHLICYAMKTNSNMRIVQELTHLGLGADTVSGGEIFLAQKAGIEAAKIVFAGVAKTDEEIDFALKADILMFNVESRQELEKINKRALLLGKKTRIAIRVNPDVDPKTHSYISTGLAKNKFGIDIAEADEVYKYAASLEGVLPIGIHMHIGSQLLDVKPYHEAFDKVYSLCLGLKKNGVNIEYINIGGGLGIVYNDKIEKKPKALEMLREIKDKIKKHDLTLILEPGRSIVGNAGVLLTKVLYNKQTKLKKFVIVDAAMNDIGRPSLYDAYHEIVPVESFSREKIVADIVGGICESTDFLAKDREIEQVEQDEYLVVKTTGGYCSSMGSNYNSRLRPCEVLIKDKKVILIRERDKFEDLVRGEIF